MLSGVIFVPVSCLFIQRWVKPSSIYLLGWGKAEANTVHNNSRHKIGLCLYGSDRCRCSVVPIYVQTDDDDGGRWRRIVYIYLLLTRPSSGWASSDIGGCLWPHLLYTSMDTYISKSRLARLQGEQTMTGTSGIHTIYL